MASRWLATRRWAALHDLATTIEAAIGTKLELGEVMRLTVEGFIVRSHYLRLDGIGTIAMPGTFKGGIVAWDNRYNYRIASTIRSKAHFHEVVAEMRLANDARDRLGNHPAREVLDLHNILRKREEDPDGQTENSS